jgi:hypothetical protein
MIDCRTRKQDALGLVSRTAPLLAEAVGESLFLLGGLEFGEKQGMSDADLLGIERADCGLA